MKQAKQVSKFQASGLLLSPSAYAARWRTGTASVKLPVGYFLDDSQNSIAVNYASNYRLRIVISACAVSPMGVQ
jgi:hypothetical protein